MSGSAYTGLGLLGQTSSISVPCTVDFFYLLLGQHGALALLQACYNVQSLPLILSDTQNKK